jgi:hypothetical protein
MDASRINELEDILRLSDAIDQAVRLCQIKKPVPFPSDAGSECPKPLVIASIARKITPPGENDSELVWYKNAQSEGMLVRDHAFDYSERKQRILAEIDGVLTLRDEDDPTLKTIICLGEFDFPARNCDPRYLVTEDEFLTKLQDICNRRSCLILAGTFHNTTTRHNEAILIGPRLRSPARHAKLRPAHWLSEKVAPPLNSELRTYSTMFGRIAILICADIYDMNIAFAIARENFNKPPGAKPIEIVLVPAYNRRQSQLAAKACERLSRLAECVVVYVNCGQDQPCHEIFVGGERVTPEPNDDERNEIPRLDASNDATIRVQKLSNEYIHTKLNGANAGHSALVRNILSGRGRAAPIE